MKKFNFEDDFKDDDDLDDDLDKSQSQSSHTNSNGFGTVRLSEYLAAVQAVIRLSFEDATWVKAEIVNMSSKGGHYYFELAEKDQLTDKTIASCRAALWRGQAQRLISQFKAQSGIELAKNLSVLVKVKSSFHPQFGFSLTIDDIDSSYTLGDLAQKYQTILKQLMQAQLIDLNRSLPTPFDIRRVLVIAPENAAGLGDFQKDADLLAEHHVCKFIYAHATFQGVSAATSIEKAYLSASKKWKTQPNDVPDLVVIIRGGGAVNDLAYLNDYKLASTLSQCPVPLWIGIGHERDRTILDEISQRSFDTPSKVIAGIRNHIVNVSEQAQSYFEDIQTLANYEFNSLNHQIENLYSLIKRSSQYQIAKFEQQIEQLIQTQQSLAQQQLKQNRQHIEQLMREILLQSPRQTLERGYAIVRVNDTPARSLKDLQPVANQPEATIEIEMHDGKAIVQLNHLAIQND